MTDFTPFFFTSISIKNRIIFEHKFVLDSLKTQYIGNNQFDGFCLIITAACQTPILSLTLRIREADLFYSAPFSFKGF